MNVLSTAIEMIPFVQCGGMGHAIHELSRALLRQGVDARGIMPLHLAIKERFGHQLLPLFSFPLQTPSEKRTLDVYTVEHRGVTVYLLDGLPHFGQTPNIYAPGIHDELKRNIAFSLAILQMAVELGQGRGESAPWHPDVLHIHGWHTALAAYLLHNARAHLPAPRPASVLTIHNAGYQGWYAAEDLEEAGVPLPTHPELRAHRKTDSLLALGIAYADKLNTVSPRYAEELHTPYFGSGLETLIRTRDADFVGIRHGIDTDYFNPATNEHLAHHYDVHTFRQARPKNKRALQKMCGLEPRPDAVVIGIVSRMVPQKGLDYAAEGLRKLLAEHNVQLVILGKGQETIEYKMRKLEWDFGQKCRTTIGCRPDLAQMIYGGADVILQPSRYEPCGLTPMIAMRYGALPVVRETGGLAETVEDYDDGPAEKGTGFVFQEETGEAVYQVLCRVLKAYHVRGVAFERMQERAMRRDWSWDKPVQQYMALYEGALAKVRG